MLLRDDMWRRPCLRDWLGGSRSILLGHVSELGVDLVVP